MGGRGPGAPSLPVERRDDGPARMVLRAAGRTVGGEPFEVQGGEVVVDASFDRRASGVEVLHASTRVCEGLSG